MNLPSLNNRLVSIISTYCTFSYSLLALFGLYFECLLTPITVGTVFVMFLVSLVFVQGSGVYWLDVFDTYAGTIPLLIIALFELVAIGWVYNYDK